jgi:hypothetical protein
MDIPVWAGVLPLVQQRAEPVPAPQCGVIEPAYVRAWRG